MAILFIYISAFAFETTFATKNGYILQELDNIPCQEPTASVVSETCTSSIDYKIPDLSKVPNGTQIQSGFDLVKSLIPVATAVFGILGDYRCSGAGTKYLCDLAHPFHCEEHYVRIYTADLLGLCRDANESCSALNATYRQLFFNCSNIENNFGSIPKIPRKLNCVDFPALKGDPFTCDANYKVSSKLDQLFALTHGKPFDRDLSTALGRETLQITYDINLR